MDLSQLISRPFIFESSSQVYNEILQWLDRLKGRPFLARYFIRSIIEMAWSDAHITTGALNKIEEWAERCGVLSHEVLLMLRFVYNKVLADSWLCEVMEKGCKLDSCSKAVINSLVNDRDIGKKEILFASLRTFWGFCSIFTTILCLILSIGLIFSIKHNKRNESTNTINSKVLLPFQLPIYLNTNDFNTTIY